MRERVSSGDRPFLILIGLLFFAPLAFGTVEAWSYAILETGIFALAFLWLLDRGLRTPSGTTGDDKSKGVTGEGSGTQSTTLRWKQVPGTLPAVLFLLFVLVQTLPLPPAFVKVLSPAAFETWARSFAALPESFNKPDSWIPLSLYPYGTSVEWLNCLSWLLAYVVSVQILSNFRRLRIFVRVWIAFAFLVAVFGILQHAAGNGKIYWFRALTEGGTPFGPYVNRNHFAGFLGLALPLAFMLAIVARRRSRSVRLKERLFELLSQPHGAEMILASFAAVVMSTALVLSLSRGGTLSFLGGMTVSGILLALQRRTRKAGRRIVILAILIAIAVGWVGWEPVMARFDRLRDIETEFYRYQAWRDSIAMAKAFPVVGTGLGTFEQVFPVFKTIPSLGLWDYAHNDYVQFVAETGLVGSALALWFLVACFRTVFATLAQRKNRYFRLVTIGGIGGLIALLLHSFVDFNLHIGANIFLFSVLMALTVATVALKTPPQNGTVLPGRKIVLRGNRGVWALVAGLICAVLAISASRPALAEFLYKTALSYAANTNPVTIANRIDALSRAGRIAPGDFRIAQTLAGEYGRRDGDPASRQLEMESLRQALRRAPTNATTMSQLAEHYERSGNREQALAALKRAVELYPMHFELRTNYAVALMESGPDGRTEALAEFGRAMKAGPEMTRYITARAWLAGLSYDDLRGAVPPTATALVEFAAFLEGQGKEDAAIRELQRVISMLHAESLEESSTRERQRAALEKCYRRLAGLQAENGEHEEAVKTLSEATSLFPENGDLHVRLARLYEQIGIPYRALEEYRQALELNPSNQHVLKKVRELSSNQ